jgi:hypothetical protein
MSRPAAILLVGAFAGVVTFAVVAYGAPFRHSGERVVGYGQIRYAGAGPERWAMRYRHARAELVDVRARLVDVRRRLRVERRVLLHAPTVREAIDLAAATYGFASTLWRKAGCETGGTFSPSAHNSSGASGLFQFMPKTWNTTPYSAFSVWSPYANALAAGWMHAHGRGGEWSCG